MFARKSLESLLSDRDVQRGQHHAALRDACKKALEALDEKKQEEKVEKVVNGGSMSVVLPETCPPLHVDLDVLLAPFEIACHSKTKTSSRLVTSVLDSLQKLVAYGHFKNDKNNAYYYSSGTTTTPPPTPTASSTAPASTATPSSSPSIDARLVTLVAECFTGPQTDESVQLQVIKALLTMVTSNHVQVHENNLLLAVRTVYNIHLASRSLINRTTAKAALNQMLSSVFNRMENAVAINEESSLDNEPCQDEKEVNDNEQKINSLDVVNALVAKILKNVVLEAASKSHGQSIDMSADTPETTALLLQRDAFLVFRSLCKLAAKPLPDGAPDPKSHEQRSKVLSMELLLSVVENSGSAFCNKSLFISAVKTHLCLALSQNGTSVITEVFELSLALFLALLSKYRRHLKSQIEIFFREVCLNIVDSSTAFFEQKWLVLQTLSRVCSEAQVVVDIYVNYDCDLGATNVFERLVDHLAKLSSSQSPHSSNANETAVLQVNSMRLKAMDCLVAILKCMVEWSRDLYTNPHYNSMIKDEQLVQEMNNNINSDQSGIEDLQQQQQPKVGYEDPIEFERVKQHKHIIEYGISLFKHKPKRGLAYLHEKDILDRHSDKSIAAFILREEHRIDSVALGDFLGELDNKIIMHCYIDLIDLANMDFLSALRRLLENFRLPGEAQKIDRIMEKFASRYIECNLSQTVFASADAAYVLAFSIIMLTTDLHSAHIKKKMTKEEFVRNNRGINESEDLPSDYLMSIYDEIASSELKTKSTPIVKTTVADVRKRTQVWSKESESISQTANALMESAAKKGSKESDSFVSAKSTDHIKPMFKLIWSPVLATLSLGLQNSNESRITQLCIEGMCCSIRISNIFGLKLERDAFMQALTRFTLLTDKSNVNEMESKNIEAIKALISVAHTDGNYLDYCWLDVLKCISHLETAQIVGSGVSGSSNVNSSSSNINNTTGTSTSKYPELLLGALSSTKESLSLTSSSSFTTMSESQSSSSLHETNSQSVIVAVDRIFTGSKNLEGEAIVAFVKALCQVSNEEIQQPQPRMFALTKLVEISYYNMERIRLEWSRIWHVLGTHFNVVGCNKSVDIAFFAVDSLKQLSTKFLEKGELDNFHFQKDFLRPFEHIMKHNENADIRDMVVQCISQMVNSQSGQIKSGWKNIFATFALAAGDNQQSILFMSFQSTEKIVLQHLNLSGGLISIEAFQDCVKCLSEFACNSLNIEIAMEAIELIRKCARFVNENDHLFFSNALLHSASSKLWVHGWFPILFELCCIVNRSSLDIRTRALTILFDIIKHYGHSFDQSWWTDLFGVLLRIFDVDKLDQHSSKTATHTTVEENGRVAISSSSSSSPSSSEWLDTTCNHALYAITDVFNEYFEQLSPLLLDTLLNRYTWCIGQNNEQLSRSAISCFENLVVSNLNKIDCENAAKIVGFVVLNANNTIKDDRLLYNGNRSSHKLDKSFNPLQANIDLHLEVLKAAHKIVFSPAIAVDGSNELEENKTRLNCNVFVSSRCHSSLMTLVQALLSSHAHSRHRLQRDSKSVESPLWVRQEVSSLQYALDMLLHIYCLPTTTEAIRVDVRTRFLRALDDGLIYFASITSKAEQDSWSDLLAPVFDRVLEFEDDAFVLVLGVVYNRICETLALQVKKNLCQSLCRCLKRVGRVYNIDRNKSQDGE